MRTKQFSVFDKILTYLGKILSIVKFNFYLSLRGVVYLLKVHLEHVSFYLYSIQVILLMKYNSNKYKLHQNIFLTID